MIGLHNLIAELLEIRDVILEVHDITLVGIAEHAAGETLTAMVIQIDAIALLKQFVGELLILDVTLHATADQQYRVVAGRVAQGDIADGDMIGRHQLTRLCMLLPECWQCGGEEVRQLGRGEQSIRVIHGLGATGHKKEED